MQTASNDAAVAVSANNASATSKVAGALSASASALSRSGMESATAVSLNPLPAAAVA